MTSERATPEAPARRARILSFPSPAEARPEAGLGETAAGDPRREAARPALRTIAVASGKGGVGKTNVVVNLAVALGQRGQRVLVLDADLGLANVDTLLGLHPRATLRHVLRGERELAEILIEGPAGIRVAPAASGFEELTRMTEGQAERLLAQLARLESELDVLLIDTGAGISANVLLFAVAAQETLVVVTPEPTSLTDAYALIKVLATRYAERSFGVLVNMARSEAEARRTFAHLARVAERFLHLALEYRGFVPHDAEVAAAVRRQRAIVEFAPGGPVARAFGALAGDVLGRAVGDPSRGGLRRLVGRIVEEGVA